MKSRSAASQAGINEEPVAGALIEAIRYCVVRLADDEVDEAALTVDDFAELAAVGVGLDAGAGQGQFLGGGFVGGDGSLDAVTPVVRRVGIAGLHGVGTADELKAGFAAVGGVEGGVGQPVARHERSRAAWCNPGSTSKV